MFEAAILLLFVGLIWMAYSALHDERRERPQARATERSSTGAPTDAAAPPAESHSSAACTNLAAQKPKASTYGAARRVGAFARRRLAMLVLAFAGLGMAVWHVGGPWSLSSCMEDAANKPTDRGVRIAEKACREAFGYK